MNTPEVCPVCYEDVPPRAKACPSCGADERSGWNEDNLLYDGLDLPEGAWENRNAADTSRRSASAGIPWFWKAAAVILLVALFLLYRRG
ncbi:MAG TPA: hypothetical protein VMN36_18290 [Verrucomicrobiales bacterium]|nr:hypothetical protein [Verrucomicrobiales bacterium]